MASAMVSSSSFGPKVLAPTLLTSRLENKGGKIASLKLHFDAKFRANLLSAPTKKSDPVSNSHRCLRGAHETFKRCIYTCTSVKKIISEYRASCMDDGCQTSLSPRTSILPSWLALIDRVDFPQSHKKSQCLSLILFAVLYAKPKWCT